MANLFGESAMAYAMGAHPVPEIGREWEIAKSDSIDVSVSRKYLSFRTPTEPIIGQNLGVNNTITLEPDVAEVFSFSEDGWYQIALQVNDGITGSPYAAGSPVALNPAFAANLCQQYYLKIGGEVVENTTNYVQQANFFGLLQSYSWDYSQSLQGITDVVILDSVGNTQFSVGGQPGIDSTNLSLGSIIATDTTNGNVLQLLVSGTSPLLLSVKALGIETITAGDTVTLSLPGPNGTVIPIFANASAAAVTGFTVGTVSSGVAPLIIADASATTAGVVYFYAGAQALSLYDTTVTKPILLTPTVTLTGVTSTVTIAAATGAVGTVTAGDSLAFSPNLAIVSSNNQSGFWARQALTDNGKILNLRIPIKDIFRYFKSHEEGLYGQPIQMKLFTSASQVAQMCQVAPWLNKPAIKIIDFQCVIPCADPSEVIRGELSKWLHAKRPKTEVWYPIFPQTVSQIGVGQSSYNQTISFTADFPEWLVMVFIPTAYLTNYNANPNCSLVPLNSAVNYGNPIASAFLTYGSQRYPNPQIGTNPSDLMQIWNNVLEVCGRKESSLMGPVFSFNQWLNNYFMLPFDLRGRVGSDANKAGNATIQIQFANNFTQATTAFSCLINRRVSTLTGFNGKMVYACASGA